MTQLSDIERTSEMRAMVRLLAARSGQLLVISRLSAGIVFYTGAQTLPFGPRLRAVPVSALWQA